MEGPLENEQKECSVLAVMEALARASGVVGQSL
jgi:hypothetical protein